MAKFQGIKIRENAMVYILEIISLADFSDLGLLCGAASIDFHVQARPTASPVARQRPS